MPFTKESAKLARLKSRANNKPPELKGMEAVTEYETKKLWNALCQASISDLKDLANDDNASAAAAGMSAFLLYLRQTGDPRALTVFLDRTIGKPKETIEVQQNPLAGLSDSEKLEKLKMVMAVLQKKVDGE